MRFLLVYIVLNMVTVCDVMWCDVCTGLCGLCCLFGEGFPGFVLFLALYEHCVKNRVFGDGVVVSSAFADKYLTVQCNVMQKINASPFFKSVLILYLHLWLGLRNGLFRIFVLWVITRPKMIWNQGFGTTYLSHRQGDLECVFIQEARYAYINTLSMAFLHSLTLGDGTDR